jgi:hypothetical protein
MFARYGTGQSMCRSAEAHHGLVLDENDREVRVTSHPQNRHGPATSRQASLPLANMHADPGPSPKILDNPSPPPSRDGANRPCSQMGQCSVVLDALWRRRSPGSFGGKPSNGQQFIEKFESPVGLEFRGVQYLMRMSACPADFPMAILSTFRSALADQPRRNFPRHLPRVRGGE